MFALDGAHIVLVLREDLSVILNALKFVCICRCTHVPIDACFLTHQPSSQACAGLLKQEIL